MTAKNKKTTIHKKAGRIHPIHKRIALHVSSILFVLGGGFVPLGYFGDTLHVSAKVSAPLPNAPAIITSPTDQQHVSTAQITVSGTCPDNTYVVIYINNAAAGTSNCSSGNFSVIATLAPNANIVNAKVFNLTDDEGPASPSITVFYDVPPSQQPELGPQNAISSTPAAPLVVDIPFTYSIKHPGDTWSWSVTLAGGVAPYDIKIDWGDSTIEHIIRSDLENFNISHVYQKSGIYYPLITITDAAGTVTTFQLVAEVREPPQIVPRVVSFLSNGASPLLAWPLYGAATFAVLGFWGAEALALHGKLLLTAHKIKFGRRNG